jgi:hypothetical protein
MSWAVEFKNPRTNQYEIYVFPDYVTKEEAQAILERAELLRRSN